MYIYVYIYTHTCVYIYIYIYVYITLTAVGAGAALAPGGVRDRAGAAQIGFASDPGFLPIWASNGDFHLEQFEPIWLI